MIGPVLHALLIVAIGLGGPALVLGLPLRGAYELAHRMQRRNRIARTRAQIKHITERATQRASEHALAELQADDDGRWLEIKADSDRIGAATDRQDDFIPRAKLAARGYCRDLAQDDLNGHARLPAASRTIASPDALLAALFQAARADAPDPMRAQPPSVVAWTNELIAEILDDCGFGTDHPGRHAAEIACRASIAYSARPVRISRN